MHAGGRKRAERREGQRGAEGSDTVCFWRERQHMAVTPQQRLCKHRPPPRFRTLLLAQRRRRQHGRSLRDTVEQGGEGQRAGKGEREEGSRKKGKGAHASENGRERGGKRIGGRERAAAKGRRGCEAGRRGRDRAAAEPAGEESRGRRHQREREEERERAHGPSGQISSPQPAARPLAARQGKTARLRHTRSRARAAADFQRRRGREAAKERGGGGSEKKARVSQRT